MNSLQSTKKIFFVHALLMASLLCHSLNGITVNNTPLHKIIKSNDTVISLSPSQNDNIVKFEINDDNICLDYGDINNLTNLAEVYESVMSKASGGIRSKTCNVSAQSINYGGSRLAGLEQMNLEARKSLNLSGCILASPRIFITGNQMIFGDCFLVNPQDLYIFSNSSESYIEIIHIIFNEKSANPTLVTGEIDLENNQTSRTFLFTNVKKIEIQFSQKALKN